MKRLSIIKFGGSLVDQDGSNIPRMIDEIKRIKAVDDLGPIIIYSAPKGYTDQLLHIGQQRAHGHPASVLSLFQGYQKIAETFIHENFLAVVQKQLDDYQVEVESTLNQLRKRFDGRAKAVILTSGGELPTSMIFDYILRSNNLPSCHVSKDDFPIITTDDFENATPLIEKSGKRLAPLIQHLGDGNIVAQAGFLGMTEDGLETILGRGGSDLSCIIDAVLLRPKYKISVNLYKEHPVKSADPKIVTGQLLRDVNTMTFNEAAKASVMGMKIVQNAAVRLAQQYNQSINVVPLFVPDQVTTIQEKDETKLIVKCVTGIPKAAIVTLSNEKAKTLEGILRHWENYEDFHDLGTETLPSSGKIIRDLLFFNSDFLRNKLPQIRQLDPEMELDDRVGIVTLIGDQMRAHPGVASAAIGSIPHINIKRAVFLPHSSQIVLVTDEKDVNESLRAIHAAVQKINV